MAQATAPTSGQTNSFVSELEARNLHPLWDRYQRITPVAPRAKDAPAKAGEILVSMMILVTRACTDDIPTSNAVTAPIPSNKARGKNLGLHIVLLL